MGTSSLARRRNTFLRQFARVREGVATQLWPVPAAAIALGVALGIALPLVDANVDSSLPPEVRSVLFSGGSDAARAVLSAIAGSLISATTLTFSLTVVALQLASSQASPRLLRVFSRDRAVQGTLALFLGTFAFALVVLRTVRDATDTVDRAVPSMSITLAVLLTLASVVALTLFLAHLARQLRVETMLKQVHRETDRTIDLLEQTASAEKSTPIERPDHYEHVIAKRSGFVGFIDHGRLAELAEQVGIVIVEEVTVGSSLIAGTPVVSWWTTDDAGAVTDAQRRHLEIGVNAAHHSGYERTSSQDVGFGIRQLVDIASKALSPGINDPTTAVHALSHISAIMCRITGSPIDNGVTLTDDQGRTLVVGRAHEFAALLDLAMTQPRRYGRSDPDVVARLYAMLREIAFVTTRSDHRRPVADQLDRLAESVRGGGFDPAELEAFQRAGEDVRTALEGRWD